MLIGMKFPLQLTAEQDELAGQTAGACRSVWNTGLEQRRAYRKRDAWMNYVPQAHELALAKEEFEWLRMPPNSTLQQTLMDLDKACRLHGTWKVHWKSSRGKQSFRMPIAPRIRARRLSKHVGEIKLPKFGPVRFRWQPSRKIPDRVRSATVSLDAGRWWISMLVDDEREDAAPNGGPAVGIDRGVKVMVAQSDGEMLNRELIRPNEALRKRRLERHLARQRRPRGQKQSNRYRLTQRKLQRLHKRVADRRKDFAHQLSKRQTQTYGIIVVENLKVKSMTKSARGTLEKPGKNVSQKRGLNREIANKGWSQWLSFVEYKAKRHGSQVVRVPAAYTSQKCSSCGLIDSKSRKNQATFHCTGCGMRDNADLNAARNILAAGLAVTGRGDLGVSRSMKRQSAAAAA